MSNIKVSYDQSYSHSTFGTSAHSGKSKIWPLCLKNHFQSIFQPTVRPTVQNEFFGTNKHVLEYSHTTFPALKFTFLKTFSKFRVKIHCGGDPRKGTDTP